MSVKFWNYNLVTQAQTVITASNENAQFPVTNLKSDFRTKVFRSTAPSVSVVFDFITPEEVDSILLAPHSGNGWGITTPVTIEANTTNTWGAPAFSTTLTSSDLDQEHEIAIKEIAAQTYRFWRLTFTGTSYAEVANVFIGKVLELGAGRSMDFGWQFGERDNSEYSENRYRQRFFDIKNRQKGIVAQFSNLNRNEMDDVFQLWDVNGIVIPFWFWIDGVNTLNNTRRHAGVFYFEEVPVAVNTSQALYAMGVNMIEAK
jgi:hypothetical protein